MRPALFLDRDGTLIVDRGYLSQPSGVELLPGVPQALQQARDAGFSLIVATNQSGVARGLMSLQEVHDIHSRLDELLALEGLSIEGYYICPHGPTPAGEPACACRKPAPELLLQAARERQLSLPESWMIGDKRSDAEAGLSAGARAVWLTESTSPQSHDIGYPKSGELATAANLPAAVRWILRQPSEGSALQSDQ